MNLASEQLSSLALLPKLILEYLHVALHRFLLLRVAFCIGPLLHMGYFQRCGSSD